MATPPADPISDRIVSAAAQLFIDEGYDATSMLAVANHARTSKREIYDRFGNKEQLFEHVMEYLCALADDGSTPPEPAGLQDVMRITAREVLTRFLQPETRGVLVAAIGASGKFPEIPRLFWQAGPGQAVTKLATLFQESPDIAADTSAEATAKAHHFVMSCVAPFTLSFLFDPGFTAAPSDIDDAIEQAITRTFNP